MASICIKKPGAGIEAAASASLSVHSLLYAEVNSEKKNYIIILSSLRLDALPILRELILQMKMK